MTDTYTDTTTAGVEDPTIVIAEGLRRLEELRTFHEQASADLEEGKEAGRQRVADLQSEVDAEIAKLNDIVIDAANDFNEESSRLIGTGWASPKVLADRGLGAIRAPKKK